MAKLGTILASSSAAILAALSAPANATVSQDSAARFACPGLGNPGAATIYLPAPRPPTEAEASLQKHILKFSATGAISLDGRLIANEQLSGSLASVVAQPRSALVLYPDKMTPFDRVVSTVSLINSMNFCEFRLAGTELWSGSEHYALWSSKAPLLTHPPLQSWIKPDDVVITVDHASMTNGKGKRLRSTCRMLLNGRPISYDKLYSTLYDTLGSFVAKSGGADALMSMSDEEIAAKFPILVIQAKSSMPWFCAAGALANAQFAGYPSVDLFVLPD